MLEPYQPGKIPVVMVHGLLSSPLTWMPVFNDLRADPALRDRFQFWFYFYPTANPYLATAADLRATWSELRSRARSRAPGRRPGPHGAGRPQHGRPDLEAADGGQRRRFLAQVSDRPFADLTLKPETRDELRRIFFFRQEPCVKRVIFLATPHHGSRLSPSPLGRLGDDLVRLPKDLLDAAQDAAAENPGQPVLRKFEHIPTSVDLLAPARRRWNCWRRGRARPACITIPWLESRRRRGRSGSGCWAAATRRATALCRTAVPTWTTPSPS